MAIRFPLDLGYKAENNFPYMSFEIIKFRTRNFIKDEDASSGKPITTVDPSGKISEQPPVVLNTVYLPLPDNIQNNYQPSWEMTSLRTIEGIREVARANDVEEGALTLLKTAYSLSLGDLNRRLFSQTPNPKKQALFNGIEPRSFQWSWTFIPYSEQESKVIEDVIRTFATNSLPDIEKSSDIFFDFPAEFGIKFKNTKGLPVLDYCVCQGVNVSYSQSNTQLMQDGRASQITLSLSFLETSLRTKTKPGL